MLIYVLFSIYHFNPPILIFESQYLIMYNIIIHFTAGISQPSNEDLGIKYSACQNINNPITPKNLFPNMFIDLIVKEPKQTATMKTKSKPPALYDSAINDEPVPIPCEYISGLIEDDNL